MSKERKERIEGKGTVVRKIDGRKKNRRKEG